MIQLLSSFGIFGSSSISSSEGSAGDIAQKKPLIIYKVGGLSTNDLLPSSELKNLIETNDIPILFGSSTISSGDIVMKQIMKEFELQLI